MFNVFKQEMIAALSTVWKIMCSQFYQTGYFYAENCFNHVNFSSFLLKLSAIYFG